MILVESLDKTYQLQDVTNFNPDLVKHLEFNRCSDVSIHACVDEPGHSFVVFRRNDAYEIHHQNYTDGKEQVGKNHLDKTPSKFVSTAFHLAKSKVDAGHPVRIIASDDHITHYHRLAKIIANKHEYGVTDPIQHPDTKLHTFLIHKNKNSIFHGMPVKLSK